MSSVFAELGKTDWPLVPLSGICRDPDDDIFVLCAVSGKAQYLVTGDAGLLAVFRYGDVAIVRSVEFLRLVRKGG